MRGPAKETKRRIIDAAYGRFYERGFARIGVDDIAEAAGVTKRTLYYHFDSKDALIAAVLEVQNELMLTRIQRWARRASGNPATVVEKLFAEFAAWARQPGWRGSGFTRAAMEFAHLPGHPARVAARRHKAAVESWLAEELDGIRAESARHLARQIMLLIEGCHSLILIHGDASYADAASEAARLLVERYRTAKRALGSAKRRR
jgi:AcrR family transcriptional regulator